VIGPDDPKAPGSGLTPGGLPLDPGTGGTGTVEPRWAEDIDLRVCADGTVEHLEIQEAIDASRSGDTIGVCPGVYGPIYVPWGFDVAIRSLDGPAFTTIDGGDDSAVFVREGALDLQGFRVTGTGIDEEWETDHGGAFTNEEGELTVRDCVVEGVTGAFALVFDEDLLVMDNVVWRDNHTDTLWFLYQGDAATITRNTVTGGVHRSLVTTLRLDVLSLTRTVFAGIDIDTGLTAFDLTTDGTGPLVVRNNVFYDIDDLDPWGGRVFAGQAVVQNNVVMDCDAWDLEEIDASYSMFWNNGVDYAPFVGAQNQYVDPQFVDPDAGDFHLRPGSPAVDAGDPRAFANDADGSRNDIGAFGGPELFVDR
jgi:hypothetical protein